MQSNEMVEKKRAFYDGVEKPGLIKVEPIKREKRFVEVPGFFRIRDVTSHVIKLPQITLVHKLERPTGLLNFFETWFDDGSEKDIEIIRTDAVGVAMPDGHKLYSGCEIMSIEEPAYDASAPTFAQIIIIVAPYDIIKL